MGWFLQLPVSLTGHPIHPFCRYAVAPANECRRLSGSAEAAIRVGVNVIDVALNLTKWVPNQKTEVFPIPPARGRRSCDPVTRFMRGTLKPRRLPADAPARFKFPPHSSRAGAPGGALMPRKATTSRIVTGFQRSRGDLLSGTWTMRGDELTRDLPGPRSAKRWRVCRVFPPPPSARTRPPVCAASGRARARPHRRHRQPRCVRTPAPITPRRSTL